MNADARLAAVRLRLSESEPDAFLVTGVHNIIYVTGFDGVFDEDASAVCLVTPDVARVYTDSRYVEAARTAAVGTQWTLSLSSGSLDAHVAAEIADEGIDALGFESALSCGRHRKLSERSGARLVLTERWVEELREVKEPAELERIAQAAALTDRAFDHILGVLAPGMTETEVAVELESFMRLNGSEGVAFPSIVASGPNSSRPHATVTGRRIDHGDPVTLDFGARIGGYCADMTRTVVVGTATDEFREVYEVVRSANTIGVETVRGGLSGAAIDGTAREAIGDAGFGEHFGHGLGHGVGLEVHELPSVGPRGSRPVPPGAVVTIEPGVYLEGRFGVRIEDLVVVESDGCHVLTTSPRGLIEV